MLLRLLVLLPLLMPSSEGVEDTNYIAMSHVFASLSSIEKTILPGEEIVQNLKALKQRLDSSSRLLDGYIENWRKSNLVAALENPKDALQTFLKQREELGHLPLLENLEDHPNANQLTEATVNATAQESTNSTRDDLTTDLSSKTKPVVNKAIRRKMKKLMKSKSKLPYGSGVVHPIDSFLLLKRLSVDWEPVKESLTSLHQYSDYFLKTVSKIRKLFSLPTSDDLNGAAVGISRLQYTFGIDIKQLGSGVLSKEFTHGNRDLQALGSLRPFDYILIGKQAYLEERFDNAMEWFKVAVDLSSNFELNDEERDVIPQLVNIINMNQIVGVSDRQLEKFDGPANLMNQYIPPAVEVSNQDRLCSGETLLSIEDQSRLHCSYERTSAYFTLMPQKVEVVHDLPRVFLIHDFLTKKQTDGMIKESAHKLVLSTHGGVGKGSVRNSMIRVSMTTWLNDQTNASVTHDISKKIEKTMNMHLLKEHSSEQYQVLNYGIGGLYRYHFDFGVERNEMRGDRLTTFLLYLKDVDAGGQTIFTRLGVGVKPERGMALVWYNLHRNGEFDMLTKHAACPVLHGSKWIATKWIMYNEQILKQPCGANQHDSHNFKSLP